MSYVCSWCNNDHYFTPSECTQAEIKPVACEFVLFRLFCRFGLSLSFLLSFCAFVRCTFRQHRRFWDVHNFRSVKRSMCRACRVYSPAMTLPLARSKRTAPDEIIALKCHASLSCVLHVDSWHLFCLLSFLLMFKLLLFFCSHSNQRTTFSNPVTGEHSMMRANLNRYANAPNLPGMPHISSPFSLPIPYDVIPILPCFF